ncbi:hypothetical protein NE865_01268 [Phthorimaea operculella]|nr:hypothetical protein NE865_01268 [Phthorimaea operculella]
MKEHIKCKKQERRYTHTATHISNVEKLNPTSPSYANIVNKSLTPTFTPHSLEEVAKSLSQTSTPDEETPSSENQGKQSTYADIAKKNLQNPAYEISPTFTDEEIARNSLHSSDSDEKIPTAAKKPKLKMTPKIIRSLGNSVSRTKRDRETPKGLKVRVMTTKWTSTVCPVKMYPPFVWDSESTTNSSLRMHAERQKCRFRTASMDKFVTRKRKDVCSSTSDDNRPKKRCTNAPKTKSNTDHGNDTTTKPSTSKSHSTEPPTNEPPTTEPPCVVIENPARPVTEPPTTPATETLATEPPTIVSTVSEPPATEPTVTVPPATEDSPNTEAQSGASKKQAQKVKIDCFNDAWLTEKQFKNWLKKITDTKGTTSAMCKYCLCTLIPHKSALIKHLQTAKHKKLVSNVETSKSISEMIKRPCEDAKKRAELKLAALIATKNLSFNLLDTLTPLLKDIFPDSEIAQKMTLCRTKGQAVVKQILGPQCKDTLVERLKTPGNFFSSVIDETTDITVKKQCALSVISFNDTTNTVETNFFDLYEVESGTGQNLCTEMLNKFREQNIPLENLVGFAAVTTNAMVGAHNSVFSHLKDEIPNIACVKCSAHSIHLVASKACLKLPRSIEDMLRNIGAHFSRSSQRKSRLTEIQKFFDEEIHTILSPCTTRWLSLKPCVDRVLEQKLVLIEYFTQELSHDPSITTDNILKGLRNLYLTVYLEFMSHTLTIFNDFNRLFQSEKPLLHCLKSEVEKLLVNLCSNYIQIQYLKRTDIHRIDFENPGRFVPLQNVYLGVAAQHSLEEMKKSPNPPPMTEI